MSKLETRLTLGPADYEAFAPIFGWAYADDLRASREWLKHGEPGHLRVAVRQGWSMAGQSDHRPHTTGGGGGRST